MNNWFLRPKYFPNFSILHISFTDLISPVSTVAKTYLCFLAYLGLVMLYSIGKFYQITWFWSSIMTISGPLHWRHLNAVLSQIISYLNLCPLFYNNNNKASTEHRLTGHLCRECAGDRWPPFTKCWCGNHLQVITSSWLCLFQRFRKLTLWIVTIIAIYMLGCTYQTTSILSLKYVQKLHCIDSTKGNGVHRTEGNYHRTSSTTSSIDLKTTTPFHLFRKTETTTDNKSVAITEEVVYAVPNHVHYIWFRFRGRRHHTPLAFHEYLSVLSTHKFIKPDHIYFHTDDVPSGPYWDMLLNIPGFQVRQRGQTKRLFGRVVNSYKFDNQASDLERLNILLHDGGIYLDLDVIALRSFNPLRIYDVTLGKIDSQTACNAVILARKHHPLLQVWLESYIKDFRPHARDYNAISVSMCELYARLW